MNLCHPQAPAALLMAGQGGNLNRQGADILLVPYIEVVACQVDGRSVVVGFPVIRRAKGDRAFLRFPGQVVGGVFHDLRLYLTFLKDNQS